MNHCHCCTSGACTCICHEPIMEPTPPALIPGNRQVLSTDIIELLGWHLDWVADMRMTETLPRWVPAFRQVLPRTETA